jgi:hypothetical protein
MGIHWSCCSGQNTKADGQYWICKRNELFTHRTRKPDYVVGTLEAEPFVSVLKFAHLFRHLLRILERVFIFPLGHVEALRELRGFGSLD